MVLCFCTRGQVVRFLIDVSGGAPKALSRIATFGLAAVLLAGCTFFPRSGPDDTVVALGAATSLKGEGGYAPSTEYAMVDITKPILSYVPKDGLGSLSTLRNAGGDAPSLPLGVGDVVQVTVYESQSGGLFIPEEAGSRPGNFVEFPSQRIEKRGYITVPYAGSVRALGRATSEVEADIVSRLLDKAIEPQVTVSIVEQNSAEVAVFGEVEAAGTFDIRISGDRVLDMISRAGGISSDTSVTKVKLSRGGGSATVSYEQLTGSNAENVFVRPGDGINVTSETKSFFAFGASGESGKFDFEKVNIDLTEAVAKAGGLLDDRADPGQVLIYRMESRGALESMGVDLTKITKWEREIPTVYRANFRKPDSFFLSSKFPMRDRDVVYVSNADSVEVTKILSFINVVSATIDGNNTTIQNID